MGAHELLARLRDLSVTEGAFCAFDGDGTLWSGDVSDDVFEAACQRNWLLPEAHTALVQMAESFGLATDGSASKLAFRLFSAHRAAIIPELPSYEMMTWCYAGRSPDELRQLAAEVLAPEHFAARRHPSFGPILDELRRSELALWLVTASPGPIVEVAAAQWGFAPTQIVSSQAAVVAGKLSAELARPCPYREAKPRLLREQAGTGPCLACFGDSAFDFELLREAQLPVAVSPKPELIRLLPKLPNAVVLKTR